MTVRPFEVTTDENDRALVDRELYQRCDDDDQYE
jgi:hypothetical protein